MRWAPCALATAISVAATAAGPAEAASPGQAAATQSAGQPAAKKQARWRDPKGDDTGPGNYEYPTGTAASAGTLDLRAVEATLRPSGWVWRFTFRKAPGKQLHPLLHVYLDTDGFAGSGHAAPLPGLGATQLGNNAAWDKVILVAPQPTPLVQAALRTQAAGQSGSVLLPVRSRWKGPVWEVALAADALGPPKPSWRLAVAVVAASATPPADGLLSMPVRVRPTESQLGGGSDASCSSHAIDVLAGLAAGADADATAQREALAWACGGRRPLLPFVAWQ